VPEANRTAVRWSTYQNLLSVRLPSDLSEKVRDSAAAKRQSMSYTIFEHLLGIYG
jgi:hypothetical protein